MLRILRYFSCHIAIGREHNTRIQKYERVFLDGIFPFLLIIKQENGAAG